MHNTKYFILFYFFFKYKFICIYIYLLQSVENFNVYVKYNKFQIININIMKIYIYFNNT